MNHEEFLRLASRHTEGLATEDEQRQLDEHVRSCSLCMEDVAESAAEADAAGREEQLSTLAALRRRPFFRWWLGAAALFFLALFGWSELRLRAEREDALQLQASFDQLTTEYQRLFRRGQRVASSATVLAAPDTVFVMMRGSDPAVASGRAFIDPASGHGYFFAHGLAPTRMTDRYQLWALRRDGSAATRISTFTVAPGGDAATSIVDVPPLDTISSFVLTLEAPTVVSPSSQPVLRGTP